ncbi:MAG: hypothetical protein U0736_15685 [Gemmataceae bacterium]
MHADWAWLLVAVALVGTPGGFGVAQQPRPLPNGFAPVKLPPGKLPPGVISIRLAPGGFTVEDIERDGKILLRITAGKTVIETKSYYLGDGCGATLVEAPERRLNNVQMNEPGSNLLYEAVIPITKLKAGSLYITSPDVNIGWFKSVKPDKR